MSDVRRENGFPDERPVADDAVVADLIRLAGRRPPVPPERAARVRATVHAEWQRSVNSHRRVHIVRRRWLSVAAAASITVGMLLTGWQLGWGPWAPGVPVASLAQILDTVRLSDRSGRLIDAVAATRDLLPGTWVETGGNGRAAVTLASGPTLRLDGDTRLRVDSGLALTLDHGAVYVDTGISEPGRRALAITTALGIVRDVGTQFEVRSSEGSVRVRVREGIVELGHDGGVDLAGAGTQLELDSFGDVRLADIPVHGPDWDWVLRIAPTFVLEGRTLDEFLEWASRETGLTVLHLDASTAVESSGILLHGSVEGLTALEALAVVLPTCGLEHRIEDGSIVLHPTSIDGKPGP